jgi:hypothetical protein
MPRRNELAATHKPCESFRQPAADLEEGCRTFSLFCLGSSRRSIPRAQHGNSPCASYGAYRVKLRTRVGHEKALGIDSSLDNFAPAQAQKLNGPSRPLGVTDATTGLRPELGAC